MTTVVQIAPEVGPGSGVAAVAYHLEVALDRLGVPTARITLADTYGRWLPEPGPGLTGRAALAARVAWFSTVGTLVARRRLRRIPDAIAVCHNDALAGDVYVNHGIVLAAMRARGHASLRMVRNPLHLFTVARDTVRFGTRAHRVVVNLTRQEDVLLRATYPRVRPTTVVIGNGVDTLRHRPPTDDERAGARDAYGFRPDDVVVLFVGHEFDRKGLPVLVEAVAQAPDHVRLLVVGGTCDMLADLRRRVEGAGCEERVVLTGRLADPTPAFHAADVFALPSAYESFGLVVLEALAFGIPVVATDVGVVSEVVVNGVNGFVVAADAEEIRDRVLELAGMPRDRLCGAARAAAEARGLGSSRPVLPRAARGARCPVRRVGPPTRPGNPDHRRRGVMRVLHVIHSDGFSGVERHVAMLAAAQHDAGDQVVVIGGDPASMVSATERSGVTHEPGHPWRAAWRGAQRYAPGSDVVNLHMTASELAVCLAPAARRVPLVTTRHFAQLRGMGRFGGVARLVVPVITRRLAAQIAVSHYVAEHIEGLSHVVHAGVLARETPDPASRGRVVLLAQRLEPEKRSDVALRAFAASGLGGSGWRLDVAGTGSERRHLEKLATSLGLTPQHVRFLGQQSNIPERMATAGLLIAPRPDEAYGLSVLEAMACGLPVVATRAGGHLETLGLLDSPALFPPGDVEAAGTLLRRLAEDSGERHRLAVAQRQLQRSRFTLEAQQRATDEVYRGVL